MSIEPDAFPLSPMQRGILMDCLVSPQPGLDVVQIQISLPPTDEASLIHLRTAWAHAQQRHGLLRTTFRWEGLDQPHQVIEPELPFLWQQRDLRQETDPESAYQQVLVEERLEPFDLIKGPLQRFCLCRLDTTSWCLVWSIRHLITDGYVLARLYEEVFGEWAALSQGTHIEPDFQPLPFSRHVAWLDSQDEAMANAYWEEQLGHVTAETRVVLDRGKGEPDPKRPMAHVMTELNSSLSERLRWLAKEGEYSVNNLFQGIWACLLAHYNQREAVVFATVRACRRGHPEARQIMGPTINTLPLQVDLSHAESFTELARQLRQKWYAMRQIEYSSLAQAQAASGLSHGAQLFSSMLLYNAMPGIHACRNVPEPWRPLALEEDTISGLPLVCNIHEFENLRLDLVYLPHRIADEDARRITRHLMTLAEQIAENPNLPPQCYSPLDEAERHGLIENWSGSDADYPVRGAHQFLAEIAEGHGSLLALVGDDLTMTYADLKQKATVLAGRLRRVGVTEETVVATLLPKGAWLSISVFAILEAGGAFAMLAPEDPPERIEKLLHDAGVDIVIALEDLSIGSKSQAVVIRLDEEGEATYPIEVRPCHVDQLAYLIYTSGSTGKPKAVMGTHRGLSTLRHAKGQLIGLPMGSRTLQFCTSTFDGAIADLVIPHTLGYTLITAPMVHTRDPATLVQLIERHQVEVSVVPPSLQEVLTSLPKSLKVLISAGEASKHHLVKRWAPGRRYINAYGPAEASVMASYTDCGMERTGPPPIGRPIPNGRIYLLDKRLRPVATGIPGEICIGGQGVTRGYRGQPALSAQRFVPDPYSGRGARLYRSGDLAWLDHDGAMVFQGRMDYQLKLRGMRLEPGEIETVLRDHPDISDALVDLEHSGGDARLVAWCLSRSKPDPTSLRTYARGKLPEYMVPTNIMVLNQWPTTRGGKIDRAALPKPEATTGAFAAPRNATEQLVCEVFAEVLGLERVGTDAHFFELGGHSLLVGKLQARILYRKGVSLPARAVFDAPTPAQLAPLLIEGKGRANIQVVPRRETMEPSPAQERLWFLEQLQPHNIAYNIPMVLRLTGELDVEALREACTKLMARHELLRAAFVSVVGKPKIQLSQPELPFEVARVTAEAAPDQARARLRQAFDLDQAPLWRLTVLLQEDHTSLLVLNMHHIISDGWSVEIFTRELAWLYANPERTLPPLEIQFLDEAAARRGAEAQRQDEAHIAWWRQYLDGCPLMLDLPTDRERPGERDYEGASLTYEFTTEFLALARRVCAEQGVTPFMGFLSVFTVLLHGYSGQTDLLLGVPHAGRDSFEGENLIGFFVNTLVVRTRLKPAMTFAELIDTVRGEVLGVFTHAEVPFASLVERLQPKRDKRFNPYFQLMFSLLNHPMVPRFPGMNCAMEHVDRGTTQFDWNVILLEQPNRLTGLVEYNTALFEDATLRQMFKDFQALGTRCFTQLEQPISRLLVPISLKNGHRAALEPRKDPRAALRERRASAASRRGNLSAAQLAALKKRIEGD